jgi:hypothetical protein
MVAFWRGVLGTAFLRGAGGKVGIWMADVVSFMMVSWVRWVSWESWESSLLGGEDWVDWEVWVSSLLSWEDWVS